MRVAQRGVGDEQPALAAHPRRQALAVEQADSGDPSDCDDYDELD